MFFISVAHTKTFAEDRMNGSALASFILSFSLTAARTLLRSSALCETLDTVPGIEYVRTWSPALKSVFADRQKSVPETVILGWLLRLYRIPLLGTDMCCTYWMSGRPFLRIPRFRSGRFWCAPLSGMYFLSSWSIFCSTVTSTLSAHRYWVRVAFQCNCVSS